MGEFDGLDDELFSERLDFRAGPPAPTGRLDPEGGPPILPVVPEPATVRLEERVPVAYQTYGRFDAPHPAYGGGAGLGTDRDERDPILLVALAGLLVLVLISTGVVFWWFA